MHGSNKTNKFEFELDLAPLLAVMVKLVPVLIVSSQFIQLSMIETSMPGGVQQAIEENKKHPEHQVRLEVDQNRNCKVIVKDEKSKEYTVASANGDINYAELKAQLVRVKYTESSVFRLELSPSSSVRTQEIVKIMDLARQSDPNSKAFTFLDPTSNSNKETHFMFPDVYLSTY